MPLPLLAGLLLAAPPDLDRLQGEWLFDAATGERGTDFLPNFWTARLTVRGGAVAVAGSPYSQAPVESTFTLDPAASPKRIDVKVPEFARARLRLPAGTVRGIYRLDGDAWEVCLANRPAADRPTELKADAAKNHVRFRVERWQGKPGESQKTARVTVHDPDGKPVAGAEVFVRRYRTLTGEWKQTDTAVTAADGTVAVDLTTGTRARVQARHPGRDWVGLTPATPAGLQRGVTVRLGPAVRVTGRLVCPDLTAVGWTNVSLQPADSVSALAGCMDDDGRFEFAVPPGDYRLDCYGERVGRKTVPLTVPAGRPAVEAGEVTLAATRWGKLVGRPAPELADVDAWAGEPTPLASLRGKVVLLHLWELSNPTTTDPLPKLVELAETHRAAGLRVVGVHAGRTGDVVTPGQYVAATADLRAKKWGGKPLPFPVALTVPDRGLDDPDSGLVFGSLSRVAADYGWSAMTVGASVLIDRRGVVRGLFLPGQAADQERLAKLLAD